MGILHRQLLFRNSIKSKRIAFLLGLLLLWNLGCNFLSAQSNSNLTYPKFKTDHVLTECFINQSLLYLGTVEKPKGSNWGEDVKNMLNSVGVKFPAPWCAAYVGIVCRNSCISYPYSGFVPNWSRDIWQEKVVWDKRKAKRSILPTEIRRGDIATIYFPNLRRDAHIFIVLGVTQKGNIVTIEGNTNSAGGREGYGVFVRVRELWQVSKVIRLIEK
jgi:hypothetical protein